MQDVAKKTAPTPAHTSHKLPSRLHHTAWVVEDQERTNAFYEETLGFPLTAFWIENVKDPATGDVVVLSHAFYGLEDGGALAFFSFAEARHKEKFKSPVTEVFNHVALNVDANVQRGMEERLEAAKIAHFSINHGYCRSLYVVDPDGFRLEFTCDCADADRIDTEQRRDSKMWLKRWIGGHREANFGVFVHEKRDFATD